MITVTRTLPELLLRKIEREAVARHVPKSILIRDCLKHSWPRKPRAFSGRGKCLALVRDLVGTFEGPPVLSANAKYLETAMRAALNRGRAHHH